MYDLEDIGVNANLAKRISPVLIAAFLFTALLVIFHGNATVGLFESSEARYAEVAREMTATGDYLSPQVDYVYHFTKPPVAYWLTAAGYEIFGMNTFGARFFLGIAAVLLLFLTSRIFVLKNGSGSGLTAAAILFFSIEFFAMAKIVTTDMYLTLWITLGFLLWSLRDAGKLSARNFKVLFGITVALAFMTKGPVPILFWLVVFVPFSVVEDRGRSLKAFLSPWFLVPLVLLGLPWFIAVGIIHPGLLSYLLTHESAQAAYSAKRFHPGPWYYYLPILLLGFLPWWIIVVAKWKNLMDRKVRLWLLWAIVPVLVWSIFPAKLPTYILPTMPAWALLAAWAIREKDKRSRALWSAVPFAAGALAFAFIVYLLRSPSLEQSGHVALILLSLSVFFGAAGTAWGAFTGSRRTIAWAFASMLCIQLALPILCLHLEDNINIRRRLGMTVEQMKRPGDKILEYKTTLFSLPFYVKGKVAAYKNNFSRKKYLEAKMPAHIINTKPELEDYFRRNPRVWIVTERSEERNLKALLPGASLVMRQGRHSLWLSEERKPDQAHLQ